MIYDKIENARKYKGISENLDIAIDFIIKNDLSSLPLGRQEICGEKVFANVMEAKASTFNDNVFEYHRNYMDIQIDVNGAEKIEFADELIEETVPYAVDCGFGIANSTASCVLGKGFFAVCMIEELHKPGLSSGKNDDLRKVVLKVRKDQ